MWRKQRWDGGGERVRVQELGRASLKVLAQNPEGALDPQPGARCPTTDSGVECLANVLDYRGPKPPPPGSHIQSSSTSLPIPVPDFQPGKALLLSSKPEFPSHFGQVSLPSFWMQKVAISSPSPLPWSSVTIVLMPSGTTAARLLLPAS